jgi:uncharacterized protein YfeS
VEYNVEITETLTHIKRVSADSASEAELKVRSLYKNEDMVLNDSDFIGVSFKIVR